MKRAEAYEIIEGMRNAAIEQVKKTDGGDPDAGKCLDIICAYTLAMQALKAIEKEKSA